jgi:hypothetical protein
MGVFAHKFIYSCVGATEMRVRNMSASSYFIGLAGRSLNLRPSRAAHPFSLGSAAAASHLLAGR